MIQDIYPSRLDNRYLNAPAKEGDKTLYFDDKGRLAVTTGPDGIGFAAPAAAEDAEKVFLFAVDDVKYFLCRDSQAAGEGIEYLTIRELRDRTGGKELFAAFTGYHLWKWYSDNRYCGRCASTLEVDDKERALRCSKCGNIIYPRINPAVIVGVINGESLLITRYNRGYAHNALIAGFVEIGETLEETVKREVMEEVGISVTNIRYYGSQPWGMAQDILTGFFCEVSGDTTIHMDETELKYAAWVRRDEIKLQPNNLSLTNEMMRTFRDNKIKGT